MFSKRKDRASDIRVDHLGWRSKLDLGIWGDVGETIRALLHLVNAKQDSSFLDGMVRKHRDALQKLNVYVDHLGSTVPCTRRPWRSHERNRDERCNFYC
jgi:thiamine pyrophosphate-dependent acetolactate synthase large subunit-like protein